MGEAGITRKAIYPCLLFSIVDSFFGLWACGAPVCAPVHVQLCPWVLPLPYSNSSLFSLFLSISQSVIVSFLSLSCSSTLVPRPRRARWMSCHAQRVWSEIAKPQSASRYVCCPHTASPPPPPWSLATWTGYFSFHSIYSSDVFFHRYRFSFPSTDVALLLFLRFAFSDRLRFLCFLPSLLLFFSPSILVFVFHAFLSFGELFRVVHLWVHPSCHTQPINRAPRGGVSTMSMSSDILLLTHGLPSPENADESASWSA